MARIAAVDFGLKRIGLAISDEKGTISFPLKMVLSGDSLRQSARNVLTALAPYAKDLGKIIVGLPLLLSGKRGEMAEQVDRFVDCLRKETTIAIETMDERLTSAQAEKALKECDYSRKERKAVIDSASASLLLQAYLDRVKS